MNSYNMRKPDQAIKRGEEYVKYGKYGRAIEVMFEVLQNRKNRTWQPAIEELVQRVLQLCLQLLNSVSSKEVLYYYKQIAQFTNTATMESTFIKFVKNAESLFVDALSKVGGEIHLDDIEKCDIPEALLCKQAIFNNNNRSLFQTIDHNIILGVESNEKMDSILSQCTYTGGYDPFSYMVQSMKFLWDCYRNVLDICKNNKQAVKIYYEVYLLACKFCVKYTRRSEMKELCKMTSAHTYNLVTFSSNPNYIIDLNDPKSAFFQIDLRLKQLDSAITLELYPHALKIMEQINQVMRVSDKIRKPSIIFVYHRLMVTAFSKAKMWTFHALSLQRFFSLVLSIKNKATVEELSMLATKTLLATIALPVLSDGGQLQYQWWNVEKCDETNVDLYRIAEIFKLRCSPTKKDLISELQDLNVLSYADPAAVQLFKLIETDPVGLSTCSQADDLLKRIIESSNHYHDNIGSKLNSHLFLVPGTELDNYYDPIKLRTFSLFLTKISSMYSCMPMKQVLAFTPYYTEAQIRRILVTDYHQLPSNLAFDEKDDAIIFGNKFHISYEFALVKPLVLDSLHRLCTRVDALFEKVVMERERPDDLKRIHHSLTQMAPSLLEHERDEREKMYSLSLVCAQRREVLKRQREELAIQKIEESKRLMDECARTLQEKEQLKQEAERQLRDMGDEMKRNETLMAKQKHNHDSFMEESLREFLEKEAARKSKEEFVTKINSIKRRIDHSIRARRIEEESKLDDYICTYTQNYNEFIDSVSEFHSNNAREKFEQRRDTKGLITQFHDDIVAFAGKCNEIVAKKSHAIRIKERKLAFIKTAVEKLENSKRSAISIATRSSKANYFGKTSQTAENLRPSKKHFSGTPTVKGSTNDYFRGAPAVPDPMRNKFAEKHVKVAKQNYGL